MTTRAEVLSQSAPVGKLAAGQQVLRLAVLYTLGLALPALVHLVPGSIAWGPVLMPLMIPVALAAFLLPLPAAMAVAVGLPLLSMGLTGMPPLAVALLLMAEGAAMIGVIRVMSRRGVPWWVAYLSGAVANRLTAVVGGVLLWGIGIGDALGATVWTAVQGLAGLAFTMAILPLLFRVFGDR